ncbi:hypothetical protein ACGF7U_31410 [Micromonospora sp. NPDC047670]|uniref:hypothetical protein n=1 Tax=Micromonospora sp. NPDC047670 TaxID=3364252 RepID=UPI00371C566D
MPVELVRVWVDPAEVQLLAESAEASEATREAGRGVAAVARSLAPRRTGEGAASIDAWPGTGPGGPHTDVAWDQDHFYMSFQDGGTKDLPARRFMADALDRYVFL